MKEIEKQDSVLTPKQQIDRLTRPGATYFNLNPFDVSGSDIMTCFDVFRHFGSVFKTEYVNVVFFCARCIVLRVGLFSVFWC